MKKISDKKLKMAISEVVLYGDRKVNVLGKRNNRADISVDKYPIFSSIIATFSPTMEVGYVKRTNITPKPEDIVWAEAGKGMEVSKVEEYKAISERHTDIEVELNDEQLEVIKECFLSRKDLEGFVEYKMLKDWLYDSAEAT
jgi:hypothetical protein